jgi:hypothetical protein
MPGPALLPIFVPSGGIFLGLVVGKVLDGHYDRKRTSATRRADAYADFIAAAESMHSELSQRKKDYSSDRVRDADQRLTEASAIVDMFGDPDVVRCAHRVWNLLSVDVADTRHVSEAKWGPISNQIRDMVNEFRDKARCDIDQKAIGERTEPAKPPPGQPSVKP